MKHWQHSAWCIALSTCATSVALAGRGPDFNGDGYDDIAITVAGEGRVYDPIEEDSHFKSIVHVLYGSAQGLSNAGDQIWHQDKDRMPDEREFDEGFGDSLAWGDFNDDGFDDLAIGVPGETIAPDASGAVHVLSTA